MKKIFLFPILTLVIAFTACGPAAENREQMLARSKVFQDSIATIIKASIAESETPGAMRAPVTPTAAPTATPAQTQPANPNIGVNQAK